MQSSPMYWIVGIAIVLGLSYDRYNAYEYVHVEVDKGVLRGLKTSTWSGTRYFSFKGIPYARPPVEELRFKAPVEEDPWVGVRDAFHHGSICPQIDFVFPLLRGQEDCLYLNVYSPPSADRKLPVMVWIHGGSFRQGHGDDDIYGPDHFIDEGVILVTMNYRLGVLGFLSTGDESAPGNAGMKDQVAALRWVRRNIAKFGGDPDNVTLFGESAGAVSVHLHILSPMSKGLFARAIIQSGSALNPWGQSENDLENAMHLAKELGMAEDHLDGAAIVEHLRTVPYDKIIRVYENLRNAEVGLPKITYMFAPSVENNVDSEEAFLTKPSYDILKSGKYNEVPIVMGYNSEEGFLLLNELSRPEAMKVVTEDPERIVPRDLTFEDADEREKFGKTIRDFYFHDRNVTKDNIIDFVNLFTDNEFVTGMNRAIELHLETSTQPIFYYRFSYEGRFNVLKLINMIRLPGTSHADELGYLFELKLVPNLLLKVIKGPTDHFVSRTMVRLWSNFAKQGNPAPESDPVTWNPVSKDKFQYLGITDQFVMDENPDAERLAFWRNAYETNKD